MDRTESWRPLFKGRRDGTLVQFICFNSGGFAIIQGEQLMRLEPGKSLENALDQFLGMIDRVAPRVAAETHAAVGGSNRLLCA